MARSASARGSAGRRKNRQKPPLAGRLVGEEGDAAGFQHFDHLLSHLSGISDWTSARETSGDNDRDKSPATEAVKPTGEDATGQLP